MSRAKDPIDVELLDLINRLHKVQQEVGGGEKAKGDEENKSKGKLLDSFLDLQRGREERLEGLREKIELSRGGGANSREVIEIKSEIRTDMMHLAEEWNELNAIYMSEARKKKVI
jgi:hypothetical protein